MGSENNYQRMKDHDILVQVATKLDIHMARAEKTEEKNSREHGKLHERIDNAHHRINDVHKRVNKIKIISGTFSAIGAGIGSFFGWVTGRS